MHVHVHVVSGWRLFVRVWTSEREILFDIGHRVITLAEKTEKKHTTQGRDGRTARLTRLRRMVEFFLGDLEHLECSH